MVDGLRPARLTVGIISAGRVGTALGVALERAEHVVVACSAISNESRLTRRAPTARHRGAARSRTSPARAELLLLAVPDAELGALVSGLAATGAVRPGTIVVHTSGANGIGVLAPLTEQGCIPLAIHPAMTFTGADEDIARLSDTCFGVTAADEIGYAIGAVAGAGDRRRAVPGPRGRPHAVPRRTGARRQPRRHRRRSTPSRRCAPRCAGRNCSARNSSATHRAGCAERIIAPAGPGVAGERAAARPGGADRSGGSR